MRIKVGIENNIEGRSLAWALDYPGCFAYGKDGSDAILRIPHSLLRYKDWVDSRGALSWMSGLDDFDIYLDETYNVYSIHKENGESDQSYEVNAFFRHDEPPLSAEDIHSGMLTLEWSRQDLLDLAVALTPAQMICMREGERWNVEGVLRHIASAEHWYLTRLNLTTMPYQQLPQEVFDRLFVVRQQLLTALPALEGVENTLEVDGELWSPRKILRRAAWHEIDHIEHIFKLITL